MDKPTAADRCECGHPKSAHPARAFRDGANPTPCMATVYEIDPRFASASAWPCPCRKFKAVAS